MVIRYCPYCKKEHAVDPRGFLAVQRTDGKITCCYFCYNVNREFRKTEDRNTDELKFHV